MANDQVVYQNMFFDYLIKRRGNVAVIQGTMDALNLRKGAVYKRMNGETGVTTSELIMLAQHFNVSLDTIFQSDKFISFEHPFLKQTNTIDFLDKFNFFLKPLSNPNKSELTYLASELPVFYYFSHKYIFNFLLSIWNHLQWTDNKLVIEENMAVTHQIERMRAEVTNYYEGHPVTEIWNNNMLANLYQQVIFSVTIRAFKEAKYVHNLLQDIKLLIDDLHELATKGSMQDTNKSNSIERTIYLNDFGNYLNVLLYQSEKVNSSFIGYDIPHFIVSYNPSFFDFSKQWIKKIKKRSVLISSEGYQFRELFFFKMETDYNQFKERVEKLMEVYY
jgi:DNA-directed RNA polymerase subunit L